MSKALRHYLPDRSDNKDHMLRVRISPKLLADLNIVKKKTGYGLSEMARAGLEKFVADEQVKPTKFKLKPVQLDFETNGSHWK